MTAPRQIIAGRTYLVTRRCTQRQFLLRPDAQTNAVFAYCLGEAALRHNVQLVAWVAMSNHYHAVVYDPDGALPRFLEHFHKMTARAMNARWGRSENLWSTEQTCVTYLPTFEDVLAKVVYVLSNPVKDELVEAAARWPGCSSIRYLDGATTVHRRPANFFSEDGVMPLEVPLRTSLPPIVCENVSAIAGWASRVRQLLNERERRARRRRLATRGRLPTLQSLTALRPFSAPASAKRPSAIRPALACMDASRRAIELASLREFRRAHDAARQRFVAGDRSVTFPPGTYRMRQWGALCSEHIGIVGRGRSAPERGSSRPGPPLSASLPALS